MFTEELESEQRRKSQIEILRSELHWLQLHNELSALSPRIE